MPTPDFSTGLAILFLAPLAALCSGLIFMCAFGLVAGVVMKSVHLTPTAEQTYAAYGAIWLLGLLVIVLTMLALGVRGAALLW